MKGLVSALAALALVASACGSGESGGAAIPTTGRPSTIPSSTTTEPTTTTTTTEPATVSTSTSSQPTTTTTTQPPATTTSATTTSAALEPATAAAARGGAWAGTTSEGEDFAFTVEDGEVTALLVGFQSDECPGDSPIAAQSFGRPLGALDGDHVEAELRGLYVVEIDGSFTSDTAASGSVKLGLGSRCGGERDLTWEAALVIDDGPSDDGQEWFDTPVPSGALPDLPIDARLYDPEAGSSRFDEDSGVLDTNGTWYLLGIRGPVFIAVPAGWTTLGARGTDNLFVYSEERDLVIDGTEVLEGEPEAYVAVWFNWSESGMEEVLAEIQAEVDKDPELNLVASAVVDENHLYAFAEGLGEGDYYRILLVVGRDQPGIYHELLAVFGTRDEWNDYYPIVRAMVESWHGLDGIKLGLSLPHDVP